jgi:hypothetical protein
MEGTGDAAGVGAQEVEGVGEHAKLHLGREEHLPPIAVGRHEPEQVLQRSHGRKGSLGLGAGEGAGGGEHSPIDAPPVIQEVADAPSFESRRPGGASRRSGIAGPRSQNGAVCTPPGSMPA